MSPYPLVLSTLTIRHPLGVHSGRLADSEFEHTRVVGVIHEVFDRVETGFVSASIAPGGATESGGAFGGRIADGVAFAVTTTLEGVKKAQPVADFMRPRVAKVIWRKVTARQRSVEANDSIIIRSAGVARWESRPAQKAGAVVGVKVQIIGSSPAQSVLHRSLGGSSRAGAIPRRIHSVINARCDKPERVVRPAGHSPVTLVQYIDLGVDPRHRHKARTRRTGGPVLLNHVEIHVDRHASGRERKYRSLAAGRRKYPQPSVIFVRRATSAAFDELLQRAMEFAVRTDERAVRL